MKVVHVAASDTLGGANRASYRIHQCLLQERLQLDVSSELRVTTKLSDDPTVIGGPSRIPNPLYRYLQPRLLVHHRYSIPFQSENNVHHSFGWPDSGLGLELNNSHYDLVNLHWVGHLNDHLTISIREIGRLRMPLVWTLHDQWAFSGAEHYILPPPSIDRRYIDGYNRRNRPKSERGRDRNRATWLMKKKHWHRSIHLVCPSNWMADCAKESHLARTWPTTVIPNPIDHTFWSPQDVAMARSSLGLPQDKPIILFGAIGGLNDPRKGGDLLQAALQQLRSLVSEARLEETQLAIFGQDKALKGDDFGFTSHYFGNITDDARLRLLYTAADVFVLPSRQDNLPNTGLEAHACGTAVVGFKTGGLVDIVDQHRTGFLAEPFDPLSLARAIQSVIECPERCMRLGSAAREKAIRCWSPATVAKQYKDLYQQLCESTINRSL